MKHTRFLVFILTFFCALTTCIAQKKTIHVLPENAKIFYNGQEVGNGSYEIKFKRGDDFVVLRFEKFQTPFSKSTKHLPFVQQLKILNL